MVQFIDSPLGRIETETDYDDYRIVDGVKVPSRLRLRREIRRQPFKSKKYYRTFPLRIRDSRSLCVDSIVDVARSIRSFLAPSEFLIFTRPATSPDDTNLGGGNPRQSHAIAYSKTRKAGFQPESACWLCLGKSHAPSEVSRRERSSLTCSSDPGMIGRPFGVLLPQERKKCYLHLTKVTEQRYRLCCQNAVRRI